MHLQKQLPKYFVAVLGHLVLLRPAEKKAFPIYFWYISNIYFQSIFDIFIINISIIFPIIPKYFVAVLGHLILLRSAEDKKRSQYIFQQYIFTIYFYGHLSLYTYMILPTKIYTPMQLSKQSLLCHKSNFIYKIFRNYFLTSFELKYDSITLL